MNSMITVLNCFEQSDYKIIVNDKNICKTIKYK